MASKRLSIIKQVYLGVLSVVLLAMMLVSSGYLVYTGLYAYVFTGDTVSKGFPPSAYIMEPKSPTDTISCADGCQLTETQKMQVREWITSFEQWQSTSQSRVDRNGLVTALSFFIVSIPLFIVHVKMLRKEQKKYEEEQGETSIILHSYDYVVAFGTLVAAVICLAMLINVSLRTWVITDTTSMRSTSVSLAPPFKDPTITSIENCADACGFSQEEKDAITQYNDEEANAEKQSSAPSSWQGRFSGTIGGLLVTIPFFLYHWMIIRKKRNS